MNRTLLEIGRWAKLLRDVGLILGVPTVIGIGVFMYNKESEIKDTQVALSNKQVELFKQQAEALKTTNEQQVEALKTTNESLKEENNLLRETSFEKSAATIDAMKKTYEAAGQLLEKKIKELEEQGSEKAHEVEELKSQLTAVTEDIHKTERARKVFDSFWEQFVKKNSQKRSGNPVLNYYDQVFPDLANDFLFASPSPTASPSPFNLWILPPHNAKPSPSPDYRIPVISAKTPPGPK